MCCQAIRAIPPMKNLVNHIVIVFGSQQAFWSLNKLIWSKLKSSQLRESSMNLDAIIIKSKSNTNITICGEDRNKTIMLKCNVNGTCLRYCVPILWSII